MTGDHFVIRLSILLSFSKNPYHIVKPERYDTVFEKDRVYCSSILLAQQNAIIVENHLSLTKNSRVMIPYLKRVEHIFTIIQSLLASA